MDKSWHWNPQQGFFFSFFFNNTHYAGCLMSGMTSLLTFELQYLSQCLVLSWHLRNICWVKACFILLYPSMISEWFCDFFQVDDVLYASAVFHVFVSVLLLIISKIFFPFLELCSSLHFCLYHCFCMAMVQLDTILYIFFRKVKNKLLVFKISPN